MIRVWNFNKSRIHSYRGVKNAEIYLDQKCIFKGEISKAPGMLNGAENYAEYILFIDPEKDFNIVNSIENNDWLNKTKTHPNQNDDKIIIENNSANYERPGTASKF